MPPPVDNSAESMSIVQEPGLPAIQEHAAPKGVILEPLAASSGCLSSSGEEHGGAVAVNGSGTSIDKPLAASRTPFDSPGDRAVQSITSILADLQAAAGPFSQWEKRHWIQAAAACDIRFLDGGRIAACARLIEDWMDMLAMRNYCDNQGRPFEKWGHVESVLRAWSQSWMQVEIRAKRDPYEWRPSTCGACCRKGMITGNRVNVFRHPDRPERLTIGEASALMKAGIKPTVYDVKCPDCQPRPDGRLQAWLKQNSFPTWIDPLSLLSTATARGGSRQ